MTALTTLLGEPGSGVYRLTESIELDVIEQVATAAGWRMVAIDTTGVADRSGVLAAMQQGFGFPEWFGHNLDALVDALRDVDDAPGTMLVWSGSEAFSTADRQQFEKVLSVLRSRTRSEPAAKFLTLLR
jgi:RNAse (barnase) inhibitor barstar